MRAWLHTAARLLATVALLALAPHAQATDYVFPGLLPGGCSGSGTSYTCNGLKLAYADTIRIVSASTVTLTVKGDLETNTNTINSGGKASSLTLSVSGRVLLSYKTEIVANITAGSLDDSNGQATVTGNISTGAGDIRLRYATAVTGNLVTTSGKMTLDDSVRLTGSAKSNSGDFTLGYQVVVTGDLVTNGKIAIGNANSIGGLVTGGSGDVTVDYGATLNGDLSTSSGKITVADSVTTQCLRANGGSTITLGWATRASGVCCSSGCTKACVVNNTGQSMPPSCGASSGPTVHHYELQAPSTAVTCAASTVTVKACADSSSPCTSAATGMAGATATLSVGAGTLAASTLTFDSTGSASTTWTNAAASQGSSASVTLSGESVTASSARQCCPVGGSCSTANSCSTSFSTAGFLVSSSAGGGTATVPAQTAGSSSGTFYLRAVKTGTTTQACEAALTGSNSVNWAAQCNNPSTCSSGNRMTLTGSSATAIASNPASGVTSTTAVTMSFDANGNAPFSFSYADVGQVTLVASKAVGGATLTGSSNAFVVKPAGFSLSAIQQAAAPNLANPGAASAGGTRFVKAGEAFAATVTAVTSGGVAAPNFGKESSPEGVLLTPTLVLPSGGTAGTLANATVAGGSFTSGVATVGTLSYSEVGIITLTPSVASGSYLGAGAVSGTASGNVGRFVPAKFALSGGSVSHRSNLSCAAASSFTYLGENFRLAFTLTAQNAAGGTTQNYAGSFAKLDPTVAANWNLAGLAGSTAFSTANARLALGTASGSFSAGAASVTLVANAVRASSPEGPYTAAFGVAPSDSDGTALGSLDMASTSGGSNDRGTVASVALRQGRLRLSNAMGAADRALALPAVAQVWTGSAWDTHTLDSCTTVAASAVAFGNLRKTLTTADLAVSAPIAISNGVGTLKLAAPGGGRSGTVDVALSLGSSGTDQSCLQTWTPSKAATAGANLAHLRGAWCGAGVDKDPAARASFGLQRTQDHTLYRRELY